MKSEEHATGATREELEGAGRVGLKSAPLASEVTPSASASPESSVAVRESSAAVSQTGQTPQQTQSKTEPARARASESARRGVPMPAREPLSHEGRVLLMTLAAGAPAVLVSLILLWVGDYTPKVFWTLGVLIACFWLG
ncbi:MAG: hypothetical protein ACJ74Q_04510, partial [Pyrinomonadaceae bacterium]